jgi:hypothetical protein
MLILLVQLYQEALTGEAIPWGICEINEVGATIHEAEDPSPAWSEAKGTYFEHCIRRRGG